MANKPIEQIWQLHLEVPEGVKEADVLAALNKQFASPKGTIPGLTGATIKGIKKNTTQKGLVKPPSGG